MSEFAFDPKDAVAKAGKVTITAPNDGKVVHELVILKTSADPAHLPMDGDDVDERTSVGEIADVEPGATKKVTLKLAPGEVRDGLRAARPLQGRDVRVAHRHELIASTQGSSGEATARAGPAACSPSSGTAGRPSGAPALLRRLHAVVEVLGADEVDELRSRAARRAPGP